MTSFCTNLAFNQTKLRVNLEEGCVCPHVFIQTHQNENYLHIYIYTSIYACMAVLELFQSCLLFHTQQIIMLAEGKFVIVHQENDYV